VTTVLVARLALAIGFLSLIGLLCAVALLVVRPL
jgi:hypothetical protein